MLENGLKRVKENGKMGESGGKMEQWSTSLKFLANYIFRVFFTNKS